MLHRVGILLVLHTLLQCLILGVQAEVDDTIEETNTTNIFEFTGKALCNSTTTRVCFMYKNKRYTPIRPVSINLV